MDFVNKTLKAQLMEISQHFATFTFSGSKYSLYNAILLYAEFFAKSIFTHENCFLALCCLSLLLCYLTRLFQLNSAEW